MAQKRMFSLQVVDTDRFCEMPLSAQALYFHFGMHGDDDGFVSSPKKIQRAIGATDSDLQSLVENGFIIPFESGVIVITDWPINNTVRSDRYRETIYQAEKSMLCTEENGKYTISSPIGCQPDTKRQPTVSNLESQYSIDEIRLEEYIDITDQPSQSAKRDFKQIDEAFSQFWQAYPKRIGKQAARKAFDKAIKMADIDTLLAAIEKQKRCPQWTKNHGQYIPNPATWLNQGRWDDEMGGTNGEHQQSDFAGLNIGTVL